MAASKPWRPLVTIIGATGTGKSNLAVDLALRFNGEIINGDAMQLYDGLPIITNKIPAHERRGVPHHLLGCIGLHETTWTVGNFVKSALAVIDEIHAKGKLPILVGGTHYYTQSLLFKDTLSSEDDVETQTPSHQEQKPEINAINGSNHSILEASSEEMHKKLKEVDPVMASRWHPRDKRKVRRSLEIWLQSGRKASEVYAEQRQPERARQERLQQEEDGKRRSDDDIHEAKAQQSSGDLIQPSSSNVSSRLRFTSLLLWTHMPFTALLPRLKDRIFSMQAQGLLSEVSQLNTVRDDQTARGLPPDTTRGIWVSIGYKEFQSYFSALREEQQSMQAKNQDSDGTDDPRELGKKRKDIEKREKYLETLKNDAIERTQIATRRYAKSQVRWIRNKLLSALESAGASKSLYVLDTPEGKPANPGTDSGDTKSADDATPHTTAYDTSTSSPYYSHILQPAIRYTQKFLTYHSTSHLPDPTSTSPLAAELLSQSSFAPSQNDNPSTLLDSSYAQPPNRIASKEQESYPCFDPKLKTHTCTLCSVTTTNQGGWVAHLKGRRHKLNVKGALKRGETVPFEGDKEG